MKYDILIVGGGMVGAALASSLSKTSLRVALVDAMSTLPEDHRLIALNDASCSLLKKLNVWPELSSHAAAIDQVHVSYVGAFGTMKITAEEMGLTTLGHVVPAKFINAALYETLANADNIHLIRPATVNHFTQNEERVCVETSQGSFEANWLIGADGTHSTIRELLAIPTKAVDYKQSALVTQTLLQRSHHGIAYERFHSTGAVAMLPLAENRVATIWTDSHETIAHLMQLSEEDFLKALQKKFGYRLGRLQSIRERFTYPLQMIHAEEFIRQRVMLIGNAAHTLHPIAAQGLNLALHEVAILSEKLHQENFSLVFQNSPQKKISLQLSHHLPSLFNYDFFPINKLRQLGMIGLDNCVWAKRYFLRPAISSK